MLHILSSLSLKRELHILHLLLSSCPLFLIWIGISCKLDYKFGLFVETRSYDIFVYTYNNYIRTPSTPTTQFTCFEIKSGSIRSHSGPKC